ncbi:MAG: InlB B-repeat-containing protein, partial [Clostridia bacterium]|nr:InlB B-repeat-containing protein [Clostridia bacterium]
PEGNVDITMEKLYTVSFDSRGGSYVSSKTIAYGEPYGNLATPTKKGHFFEGWYTDIAFTEKVTSETSMTKTEDHTLYAKWKEIVAGEYIAYQPTSTEYIVFGRDSGTGEDQVFAPSSIVSWKIFNSPRDDDDDHIEIISAESIGDLTLKGRDGYIYAIDTLNRLCSDYVNTTYATSGRCLGYGDGVGVIDESKYPITFEETYTNGNTGFPYTDSYNTKDISRLNKAVGGEYPLRVSGTVWLASRIFDTGSRGSYFSVRYVYAAGGVYNDALFQSTSGGGFNTYSSVYGVRPVISLKSGIRIVGGDGTSENPYQIAI